MTVTGVKVEAVEVLVELIYKGICNLEQVFQYSMENNASGVFARLSLQLPLHYGKVAMGRSDKKFLTFKAILSKNDIFIF